MTELAHNHNIRKVLKAVLKTLSPEDAENLF